MTKGQYIILLKWIISISLIMLFIKYDDWLMENWGAIHIPFSILIIIISAYESTKEKRHNNFVVEMTSKYPWIVIYEFFYMLLILIGMVYFIANDIQPIKFIGVFELLAFCTIAYLPFILITQVNKFIKSGIKPNK